MTGHYTPEVNHARREFVRDGGKLAPAEITHMLDHVDTLNARLEAARELHEPIRVYTECDHDNCTAEHIEVPDYTACENSFEGYACGTCCFGGTDYMQEWCPHGLDHTGLDADHACPTRAATYSP